MNNDFYAMMSRMKYITRWGLMRNTIKENISEHSLEVAMLAHSLGVINNVVFKGSINPERLAVLGIYHDVTEIITGDMPTPVKYYDPKIRNAYRDIEIGAKNELLKGMPNELRDVYDKLLVESAEEETEWKYVKAADKLSAYIKCIEEKNMGNTDFLQAEKSIRNTLDGMELPEVRYFLDNFMEAYDKTIDETR